MYSAFRVLSQLTSTKKAVMQAIGDFGISLDQMYSIIDCDKESFSKNDISYDAYRRLLLLLKLHNLLMDKFNSNPKKICNWMNKSMRFNGELNKKPKHLIHNEFNMNRLISLLEVNKN